MADIPKSDSVPAVPIIVGITGHRDLIASDLPALKKAIMLEFERVKALCSKGERSTPIVVVSALAEGADRLAAQVALEMNLDLLAVLPMPRNEYENDFSEPASLAEFRELYQRATHTIELPILDSNSQPVSNTKVFDRELQYEQLGLYIDSNCHILIALWDGEDKAKRGGTADVVNMRRGRPGQANPIIFYSRSALPIGYGIQILTPRQSHSEALGKLYSRIPIVPDSWKPNKEAKKKGSVPKEPTEQEINEHAQKLIEKIVSNTNELNAGILTQIDSDAASVKQSREYLFEKIQDVPSDEITRQYIEWYSVVDSLANRYKAKRVGAIKSLFVLIVSAFIWFELHVKIFPHVEDLPQYLPVVGYVILVGSIFAVYLRAKHGRIDEKHEDYRVLAEALRVQVVWRLSGVPEAVTDHCIPKQIGELSWIRLALFGLTFPHANSPTIANSALEFVRMEWVEGQRKYYVKSRNKHSREVKRVVLFGGIMLISCACIASLLCIPLLSPHLAIEGWQLWASKGLVMLVAALLAIAAAKHGYVEMLALAEQSHQYDRMGNVFDLANKTLMQLGTANRPTDMQDVLLKLGKEALQEHSDWLIMHRARPLEVPRL